MEKLACILTEHLIRKNVITEEKRCIYEFGFQIGMEVCLNTVISILIAIACGMVVEAIVFFWVFIALRSYAGGLHLRTYLSCLLCSCLSLFILLSIVKYFYIGALYSLAIECISLFLIRILAPVQDINRKMEREEIVKFGKKLDCSIIKILFLSILFCILKFYRLLQVVSVTAAFMVGILVIGKISYKKAVSNNQQCI
ncbi:accessory gene regulator B family protein [Lachnospiraceae bacterium 66-29]